MADPSANRLDKQDSTASVAPKRNAADAGLPGAGARPHKSVKRRASKACQCCRARKVRCNVVEQTPCTNCRLDEVECIVSESKRKKKWTKSGDDAHESHVASARRDFASGESPSNPSPAGPGFQDSPIHVPHTLYQDLDPHAYQDSVRRQSQPRSISITHDPLEIVEEPSNTTPAFFIAQPSSPIVQASPLPTYIKPLPLKYNRDDIAYLTKKGALSIPSPQIRNALLRSFVDFIYPYMPLLDIHELICAVDANDGKNAISLLLFQAIMFAGCASVDMKYIKSAGYETRREARRDFFQKTRLLYDFDYEVDRISLIQALLLMTYWYETPDDQKDSHHWMGIAVSLSHTIGLHRNPERSNMDPKRRRLWKRIWWSTFMRDRLVALGMRRPTRIKSEDFDVPMLTVDDFEIAMLPTSASSLAVNSTLMQNISMQRDLAIMCIEKAKLCICISHVLTTQYSVLHNNHGIQSSEGSTRTTMMLVARKDDPESCGVRSCDSELQSWKANLAAEAEIQHPSLQDAKGGNESVVLNRSLLHMVYYATLSALHRPQVLPSTAWPTRNTAAEVVDTSRKTVRHAAAKITAIAQNLAERDLVRYLPTSGVTVLLPAIIIHLLDIKAPHEQTRRASLQGFCQCMQVLNKLRDIYAAADYSTAFLEAAIRKAEISLPAPKSTVDPGRQPPLASTLSLVDVGRKMQLISTTATTKDASRLTPPPEQSGGSSSSANPHQEEDLASRLNSFLASTPPHSEDHIDGQMDEDMSFEMPDFEPDFDALLNLDAAGEAFALDDGAFEVMQGDNTGFTFDMDWMRGSKEHGVSVFEE